MGEQQGTQALLILGQYGLGTAIPMDYRAMVNVFGLMLPQFLQAEGCRQKDTPLPLSCIHLGRHQIFICTQRIPLRQPCSPAGG